MRYHREAMIAAVACLMGGVPSLARGQLTTTAVCPVENAQVSVTFSGMDVEIGAVRSKLDAKITELKSLVAEQHLTKALMQSFNYNINTSYIGSDPRFQYNGNVSFSILPADKAVDFMEMLVKKGYQANVSVSSYNNGNCAQRMDK